ncbi:MAG: extracellular solute-binding protein [Gammaproteobacteria bacterium]
MQKLLLISFLLAISGCSDRSNPESLVVYTSRQPQLIEPLFEQYTKETGIKIVLLSGDAQQLLERINSEGETTAADLFITVDAGVLWQAAEKGILAQVDSELLDRRIPNYLRDPDNQWFGLSKRLRTIVVNDSGLIESPETYEDLSSEKWKNRLCLRTSQKVYNQSLIASLISNIGEDQAIKVVRGWVNNLSTKVFSSDTLALKAVQAGQCDATIVNSYYLGRLLVDGEGTNLNLVWANQGSTGVHVNISGGGLVRYSKKPEAAINLLEWLTSEWAQEKYAYLNLEYPVVQGTKIHPILESWGSFKEDDLNAKLLGALQRDAVLLARKTNYD